MTTQLISSADVTAIRALVAAVLPDTCSILRNTGGSDNEGGQTDTWTTEATGVPCEIASWMGRSGGHQAVIDDLLDASTTYRVFVPVATDVRFKDRITAGSRLFEVAAVMNPGSLEVERECICTERLTA
jgi:head-tail adaptor